LLFLCGWNREWNRKKRDVVCYHGKRVYVGGSEVWICVTLLLLRGKRVTRFLLCRMTLLLGPPGSGKSSLLMALAGKLDKNLKVAAALSLSISYWTFFAFELNKFYALIFFYNTITKWGVPVLFLPNFINNDHFSCNK